MRYAAITLATVLIMFAGQAPAAPTTSPASRPTLNDRRAFFHELLIDGYQKAGRHNPKWDDAARQLLQLSVSRWTNRGQTDPNLDWQIKEIGDKAIAAGCDDPMVIYQYVRASASFHLGKEDLFQQPFFRNLAESQYHPLLKVVAFTRLAENIQGAGQANRPDVRNATKSILQCVVASLPAAFADPRARVDIADVCTDLSGLGKQMDGDRKPLCDLILGMMEKQAPDSAVPDYFQGMFYCKYAWDARGNGFADTVTEKGAELFDDRLKFSTRSFEHALEKDPHLAEAWAEMLQVLLGLDQGRGVMEQYFQNAIKEDPGLWTAYHKKLYYLTPKWHGSVKEQWKFGEECLASGQWETRIPFLLLEAHENLYEGRWRQLTPPNSSNDQRHAARDQAQQEFYRKIPAAWNDARKLYETYLAKRPDAIVDRTQFAKLAVIAGHPEVAQQQLEILGEKVVPPIIGDTDDAVATFRALVQRELKNRASSQPASD